MKRTAIIVTVGLAVTALFCVFYKRQRPPIDGQSPSKTGSSQAAILSEHEEPSTSFQTNVLGDTLTDAHDPRFLKRVFPKFREFVARLDRLSVNPLRGEIQPDACTKIRIINTQNGFICPFVIADRWTADYTLSGSFEGITRFGQRGADNPFRAISRGDMETLRRLSENATNMSEGAAWPIAAQIANAFQIDGSHFESPIMHEEGLYQYRLGMKTVRYRLKDSDPLNQMNYAVTFTLKATSPTTAVLVSYSDLDTH